MCIIFNNFVIKFPDETQQNIENNKKNSCYEEEFLPALGRVKPTCRRSSVTSLVHTLKSIQIDSPTNNKVKTFFFKINYMNYIFKFNNCIN